MMCGVDEDGAWRERVDGDRGAVSRVAARSFARAASARAGIVAVCGARGVET